MIRFLTLPVALAGLLSCASEGQLELPKDTADKLTPSEQGPRKAAPQLDRQALDELARTVEPRRARNGELRINDPRLARPEAAAPLLKRLAEGGDSEAVKQAIIRALPRTQGDYAAELVKLLRNESSAMLRDAQVDALRLAGNSTAALAGISLGLADRDPQVRARAAYVAGRRKEGATLSKALIAALSDQDSSVQIAAARSLGHLEVAEAIAPLQGLLSSDSPELRLVSLRSISRTDKAIAKSLPELSTLQNDSDDRVRKVADRLVNERN